MSIYDAQIKRIHQRLRAAEKADRGLKVFGASSHRYILNFTATQAEVAAVERKYSIELPEAYKAFVTQVGNGGDGHGKSGAGPFYGIYPLGKSVDEHINDDEGEKLLKEDCLIYPGITDEEWKVLSGDDDDHPHSKRYSGILTIGSQGCTYVHGLVLNGPYKGRVVNLDIDWQKPHFTFENNFLDWYERWLDEILSGELLHDGPAWFGYQKGGTEEELLTCFINAADAKEKEDCLNALYVKHKLKTQTLDQIENLLNTEPFKVKLTGILLKFDYERAKPHLLELSKTNLADALEYVYGNAKDKVQDWLWVIKENIGNVKDKRTLEAVAQLLVTTDSNFGELIVPFTTNENVSMRKLAYYALGQSRGKRDFMDVFINGLHDTSDDVVRSVLQALSNMRDERLIPHLEQLKERFPEEQDKALMNLLKEHGLIKLPWPEPPAPKKKWYQIWK